MKKSIAIVMALFACAFGASAATKGSNAGHDGVQLWSGGPYWATMNYGAKKATEAGYYYLNNNDTTGYAVKNGALKGSLVRNSGSTVWGSGWRQPTTAEAKAMKEKCKVLKTGTDASGQPYVVIVGTTSGYTDNSITIPLGGYGNGGSVSDGNRWGSYGKYWTSDSGIQQRLAFTTTAIELANGGDIGHGNYYTIRPVCDSAPGAYSGGGGEEGGGGSEISPSGDTTGAKDAAAIQKALDAAKTSKSAVTLASGTFYLNKELLVAGGVTLEGAGSDKTTVKQVASGARVMTVSDGSTVKNITITGGNYNPGGNYKYGGGVLVSNGNISWCVIKGNSITAGNVVYGGGVCFTGPGKIDHSIVTENKVTSTSEYLNGGGGIGLSGVSGEVIVDTCLVTKNTVAMSTGHKSGRGGGIGASFNYASTKLTIRNTTIAGNTAGAAGGDNSSKGGAVYTENDTGKTLKMINCIVAENTTLGSGADVNLNYAGGVTYCLFDDAASNPGGTGCKVAEAKFAGSASGNYTLVSGSPAKGAGTTYSGIGEDLAHTKFGNPPSMGCYEGGSADPASGGTKADYYVSTKGSDSNAGTSREKPFLTIQHAVEVAAAGKTICVLKGTYNVKAPGTMYKNTAAIVVDKALKIIGDTGKPEDVIVHNSKDWVESGDYSICYRVFLLNNAGAVISGLTVENGNAHGNGSDPKFYGANVFIDTNGGTVTNCIIRNGRSNTFAADVGKADPSTKGGVGGIACFSSQGLITHCVITNNFSSMGRTSTTQTVHDGGAAVYLSAGILRQSLIAYNTVTEAWTGSAVYAAEGEGKETLIENCTIANNKYVQGSRIGNYNDAGQLYPIWIPLNTYDGSSRIPEIRNCLIYGNTTHNGSKVLIEWARNPDSQYAKAKAAAAAAFVNCATDMTPPSGMTAVTTGIKVTSDFRPTDGSSLIDAGATMKSPVTLDLARITRVKRSAVDIGCYEYPEGEQPHSDDPESHTHEWGDPTYVWEETADGYKCTATAICKGDKTHKNVETVKATYKETKAATKEATGTGVYTAVFTDSSFTTQTKNVTIPKLHDHVYGTPTFVWAEDGSSCTATATCTVGGETFVEEAATITTNLTAATCDQSGHAVYTASFTVLGKTSKKEVDLPPTGHSWESPVYEWTADLSACTGKTVCENNINHVTNETVMTTYDVLQPATDTRDGTAIRIATFKSRMFSVQIKSITLPNTGSGDTPSQEEEGGGDADGHEGVQLWEGGPYWATMNCGATAVGEVGSYYYNWDDTVGFHVKGGATYGTLEKNSGKTKWDSPWRKPTQAEISTMVSKCKVTETKDFNGVKCAKVSGTGAYADKYVWFPLAGWGNGGASGPGNNFGNCGKYWAEGSGGAILQHLMVYSGSLGTGPGGANHGNYYTMRLVADKLGPSHKHVWGQPRYTWAPAANDWYSCSGTATCLSNATHTVTESASITYKCYQPATDTAEGTGLFIAVFKESAFSTQVFQITIPKGKGDGEPGKDTPPGPAPEPELVQYSVTNITRVVDYDDEDFKNTKFAYETLDEAILDAVEGDELMIIGATTFNETTPIGYNIAIFTGEEFDPASCPIEVFGNSKIIVSPGCRAAFRDLVFVSDSETVIDVQYGGIAAFAGTIDGVGVVKTADVNGFELSGLIQFINSTNIMVDCAATKEGGKFGNWTDSAAKLFAEKINNANDGTLESVAEEDGSLVWPEHFVAYVIDNSQKVKFRTLDALFAKYGDTKDVYLLRDCPARSFTNALVITRSIRITSDSDVVTITPDKTCAFDINNGGALTLENINFADYKGPGLFRVNAGGTLNLKNGTKLTKLSSYYKDGKTGGPVSVLGGTLNMESGVLIENCKAGNSGESHGGGIYVEKGVANLLGGKVTGCTATTSGGGVYAYNSGSGATINVGGDFTVTGNFSGSTANRKDDDFMIRPGLDYVFNVKSALTGSIGIRVSSVAAGDKFAIASSSTIASSSAKAFFNDSDSEYKAVATSSFIAWKYEKDNGQCKDGEAVVARVIDSKGVVKSYPSIQAAFDFLSGDATIELLSNDSITRDVDIPYNVTLRTASGSSRCSLGRDGNYRINVGPMGSLTVSNLRIVGTSSKSGVKPKGRMISVAGGKLTLKSGAYIGNITGGLSRADSAVVIDQGGTLEMQAGSEIAYVNNTYNHSAGDYAIGAGVLVDRDSTANFLGGTIHDCTAVKGAGVAICNNSTANISGGFSCSGNNDLKGGQSDFLVEDSCEMYLTGILNSDFGVGRIEGVRASTEVFGKVQNHTKLDRDSLAKSASQFYHDVRGDFGVVVTNKSSSTALLVWNSSLSKSGTFIDDDGKVYGMVELPKEPEPVEPEPVPPAEPQYYVITNTPTEIAFTQIVRDDEAQTSTIAFASMVKGAKYSLYTVTTLDDGFDVSGLNPFKTFIAETSGEFKGTFSTPVPVIFWKVVGETTYVTNYVSNVYK